MLGGRPKEKGSTANGAHGDKIPERRVLTSREHR